MKYNVVPFQNGGQITDFYFASFRFWLKSEKLLSQWKVSMKFGTKYENMNRLTLLKFIFTKLLRFKMAAQTIFFLRQKKRIR